MRYRQISSAEDTTDCDAVMQLVDELSVRANIYVRIACMQHVTFQATEKWK